MSAFLQLFVHVWFSQLDVGTIQIQSKPCNSSKSKKLLDLDTKYYNSHQQIGSLLLLTRQSSLPFQSSPRCSDTSFVGMLGPVLHHNGVENCLTPAHFNITKTSVGQPILSREAEQC